MDYTLINNDENLKEEIGIYDDDEIMRISLFMKKFIDNVQIDDDENKDTIKPLRYCILQY